MRLPVTAMLSIATIAGTLAQSQAPVLLTVRQADQQGSASDLMAASISADARYIAFVSYARLAAADTNDRSDIYVLDRHSGEVSLESLTSDARLADRDSEWPRLSGDGRRLVYETTLDAGGSMPLRVIVLRDRSTGTSRLLRRGNDMPDGPSRTPVLSVDGRIVVFASCATNLTAGPDANGRAEDVYAYNIDADVFSRVSVDSAGRQLSEGMSFAPAVSANGRYVAFTSTAPLDGPTGSSLANVYVRDVELDATSRISVCPGCARPNGASYDAAIAGNGQVVAFVSEAANLAPRDDNRLPDVFVRDIASRTTTLISRGVSGRSANGMSNHPAISADGRVVAFQSEASDLTCGSRCGRAERDINLVADVFLFDRDRRTIRCISSGRSTWMEPSASPAIDATGTVVAFSSRHPIDGDDLKNDFDLFVRVDVRPQ